MRYALDGPPTILSEEADISSDVTLSPCRQGVPQLETYEFTFIRLLPMGGEVSNVVSRTLKGTLEFFDPVHGC